VVEEGAVALGDAVESLEESRHMAGVDLAVAAHDLDGLRVGVGGVGIVGVNVADDAKVIVAQLRELDRHHPGEVAGERRRRDVDEGVEAALVVVDAAEVPVDVRCGRPRALQLIEVDDAALGGPHQIAMQLELLPVLAAQAGQQRVVLVGDEVEHARLSLPHPIGVGELAAHRRREQPREGANGVAVGRQRLGGVTPDGAAIARAGDGELEAVEAPRLADAAGDELVDAPGHRR
jgi:hypothetical protein